MTVRERAAHTQGRAKGHPTRRWILLGLLATAPVSCATGTGGGGALAPLPEGVQANTSEQSYDVTGTTVEEIGRSLEESATAALGPEVAGRHNWDVRWNYRYAPQGGACAITGLTMELNSVITLPRWRGRDAASPAVVELWDRYLAQLRAHERGHRELSYQATREIHGRLVRLRVDDCDRLPDRASGIGQAILERYKERNRAFDADPANTPTWPPGDSG